MQWYADYAPTGFDQKGLGLPQQQDWFVVLGRNRDSGHLEQSNFEAALEALGGESDDVEIHRSRHWGVRWLENLMVRPDTAAAAIAAKLAERLANYPVLDEQDYCTRQHEAYLEAWKDWGARDFTRALATKLALDDETHDALEKRHEEHAYQLFFESLVPSGDYHDDGSPVISRAIENVAIDDVAAFLAGTTEIETPNDTQAEMPV